MTEQSGPKPALHRQTDIAEMPWARHVHQHNPKAVRYTKSLSDAAGLSTLGASLVTLKPGDYSTEFHTHLEDEEFLFILSGHGEARIGTDYETVGPGDFMGFKKQSAPHSLYNPYEEDLVYFVAGTRPEIDICDYPDLDLRQYRIHGDRSAVSKKHLFNANPTLNNPRAHTSDE